MAGTNMKALRCSSTATAGRAARCPGVPSQVTTRARRPHVLLRSSSPEGQQGTTTAVNTASTTSTDDAAGPAPSPVPSPAVAQSASPAAASPSTPSVGPTIAAGAVLSAIAAFAATNLLVTGPTLATLESRAVPLEQALTNGKPTMLEFYADWCEVCKSLVPDEYELQKQYGDKVNFVMLNIENSKWAQEAADYQVGGIPHFVFLDKQGTPLAAAVGRVPKQVLEGNLSSLAEGSKLPFAAVRERAQGLTPPAGTSAPRQAMPRDHA